MHGKNKDKKFYITGEISFLKGYILDSFCQELYIASRQVYGGAFLQKYLTRWLRKNISETGPFIPLKNSIFQSQ